MLDRVKAKALLRSSSNDDARPVLASLVIYLGNDQGICDCIFMRYNASDAVETSNMTTCSQAPRGSNGAKSKTPSHRDLNAFATAQSPRLIVIITHVVRNVHTHGDVPS